MSEQITEVKENAKGKGKGKGKIKVILVLVLMLVLIGGAAVGFHFIQQGVNYLSTDNARVTTNLIYIVPSIPGPLERFTIYEGRYVRENEVLGWVENDRAMRSPIDGLVVQTNAIQNQMVSPMEPLAIIADINNIHIEANIRETDILRVQLGQPVVVTIDALGNQQFSGYVSNIGRITQAELAGTALFFNTGGNFTRITHLIPIEIKIVDDVNLDNLIGVNARVRISVR